MKSIKATQEQSVQPLRVNVKLAGDSDLSRCRGTLSRFPGVQSAAQTFPDESDEELKRLFVLEIEASKLESVLKELRRWGEVDYAEQVPPRKLIR